MRSAFLFDWLFAQPINAFELLFRKLFERRHLHGDRRFEGDIQLFTGVITPDGCDHLPSLVIIGTNREMSWGEHAHKSFAVIPTIHHRHRWTHPLIGGFGRWELAS